MSDYFLLLVFALLVIPGNFENYDVLIIPVLNANRRKFAEVFLLPRNLELPKHHHPSELDREDIDEANEPPNVDNYKIRYSQDRLEIPSSKLGRASSDGTQNDEYNDEDTGDRIVDGFEVDINMYPYNVAYGATCGGAIIDSKWVLTAGHCRKKDYIRTGSKYRNKGNEIKVRNNYTHPLFNALFKNHLLDYDFQLLELQEGLSFDENTQPVKLGRKQDMVIGKVVTVTGWGKTHPHGEHSSVLRAMNVPIISMESCQQVALPYFDHTLTSRMFCAGYGDGKMDACQGDSGGPAVYNDRLLGMVSFGYGCAISGSYGVYSKVAEVRNWIENVTGLNLD